MFFESFLFLFFSSLALFCASQVIVSRNPIHAVLFLVLVFFNVAGLLIILGAEFLALLFLIVYVGAVAILFLFIIMLIKVKTLESQIAISRYFVIGGILSLGFLFEVLIVLNLELVPLKIAPFAKIELQNVALNAFIFWPEEIFTIKNIEIFASVFYVDFGFCFLIAGVILLISMIGAILLTLHRRVDVRKQLIYKQIGQSFFSSIELKKLNKFKKTSIA